MQTSDLEPIHRRIRRAQQKRSTNLLGFSEDCRLYWGYETRRAGEIYNWDGLNRGISPQRPQVIYQYCLDGRGAYEEGGKIWPVEPGIGFTVVMPSDHRYYLPGDSPSWTFFWLIIQHPFVSQRIAALRRNEAPVQSWGPDVAPLETAVTLFESASSGLLRDVWSLEKQIFSWLLETERELHQRRYPRNGSQRLLDETRRLILSRLHHPFRAEELADLHQMERTTFSRRFKETTGLSPSVFITEVRLGEAVKLLSTDVGLEEVAAQTGFANANHFCKVFRRHFHLSPGAWRRSILKG